MAEASRGPGRFEYEDDAGSSQGLWILALVVAAVVASFLFGRYVIGEKLKGNANPAAAQAPVVAPAPALGQDPGTPGNSSVSITSNDAAAAGGTAAGALDAGMSNAATATDPLAAGAPAATDGLAAEPPKPATTTITAEEPAKPRASSAAKPSASGKSLSGGYDKAQPNKPFKPGAAASKPSVSKSTASKPSSASAAPKSGDGDKASSSDTQWRVQVGSYSTKDSAEKQRRELSAKGHQSSVREAEVKGKTVYRVVVSTHRDEGRAREVAKKVEGDGFDVSVEH